MKTPYLLHVLCAILVIGCAQTPIESTSVLKKVTQSYESTGDSTGMHPSIYAKRTIIQFDSAKPRNLLFLDEFEKKIDYRVEGSYFIFNSIEDIFTVQTDKRVATFNIITPIEASDEEISLRLAAEKSTKETIIANKANEVALAKQAHQAKISTPIFEMMKSQISQQRNILNKSKSNSKVEKEEISNMKINLNMIESKIDAEIAVIQLYFPSSSDHFKPSDKMVSALLPAAKVAKKINLFSRLYGKGLANQKYAMIRAQSVKQFLVSHGVAGDKVYISDVTAGDYLVPNNTNVGRKINKRVTLELIN